MQVLVLFSQCQASVYASPMECKPRLYLKEPMYFSPDTNVFKDIGVRLIYKYLFSWSASSRQGFVPATPLRFPFRL